MIANITKATFDAKTKAIKFKSLLKDNTLFISKDIFTTGIQLSLYPINIWYIETYDGIIIINIRGVM
ncbi:hypothetical protein [Clostridioides difficile]|uniref:hypothetical protein n=1 Tax=Clostridioides difficile TaxID=1496 RepID=UPI001F37E4D1|nr:hypothetical protein [Clostridioides difficile]